MSSLPEIALEWQRFAGISREGLYELLRFRQAIFVVEQASPYPDLDGLDREAQHLLLRLGGALGGCLRLIELPGPPPRVRIGRVAIALEWRGRGLGRRLMNEALTRCSTHHPEQAILLTAQLPLKGFYESLGFAAISEPFDDFGLRHLDMRRPPG